MTHIHIQPGFTYNFVSTSLKTAKVLMYAMGHLLFVAGIISIIKGSDFLLVSMVDGTLLRQLSYALLLVAATSVVTGLVIASARTFLMDMTVIKVQLAGQSHSRRMSLR